SGNLCRCRAPAAGAGDSRHRAFQPARHLERGQAVTRAVSLHDALPISVAAAEDGESLAAASRETRDDEGRWAEAAREIVRELERSEEHTSELQSRSDLVCRLLREKKKR